MHLFVHLFVSRLTSFTETPECECVCLRWVVSMLLVFVYVCLLCRETQLSARPVPRANSWRLTRAVEWDGGLRTGMMGGREAALHRGRGVSSSHLQAWLNNRMLYENKNIICLLKARARPSNWLPPSLRVDARLLDSATKKSGRSVSLPPPVELSSVPYYRNVSTHWYRHYKRRRGVSFNQRRISPGWVQHWH